VHFGAQIKGYDETINKAAKTPYENSLNFRKRESS